MAAAIVGATCASMVQAHEGLRTKAYIDPVGIPTICYGHTGPEVKLGLTYTVEQCNRTLLVDLAKHRKEVERCVHTPLTPNQRDALVSFTFNVGGSKFCNSTMAKKLNRKDYIGAADEFPKWVNGTFAKPQRNLKCRPVKAYYLCELPGLIKRRRDERNLFLTIDRPEATLALSGAVPAILSR